MRPGTQVERLGVDCRRGHKSFRKLILCQKIELATGFEDIKFAFLITNIDASARDNRRAAEVTSQALGPYVFTARRIQAGSDSEIADDEKQVAHQCNARLVGISLGHGPSYACLVQKSVPPKFDSEHTRATVTRWYVGKSMSDDRPRAWRMRGTLFDSPKFLASSRIIPIVGFRTATEQNCLPFGFVHMRCGKPLAHVTVRTWLAIRV